MIDASEHMGLVYKWGWSYARAMRLDRDDCVGAAQYGLMRAVKYFRPETGNKFSTFAVACIKTELNNHFRSWERGQFNKLRPMVSLDAESRTGLTRLMGLAGPGGAAKADVRDLQMVRDLAERWDGEHTDQRGTVILLGLSKGWTLDQMATELGLTRERMRQLIMDFRKDLGQHHEIAHRHRSKAPQQASRAFMRSLKAA